MNTDWRILRWALLITALGVFLASLILPVDGQSAWILPWLPMGLVVLGAFTGSANWVAVFVIVPLLAFLASPFLAIRRPRGGWGAIWMITTAMPLGAWILPPASTIAEKLAGQYIADPRRDVSYGFYIYAIAHTLAFLGCIMAPFDTLPASRKRGFPVVVPNESAERSGAT